jgi:hypothetical protein
MNGHQSAKVFSKTLHNLEFEDRIIYIKERFNRVILVSGLQVPDQLLTWVLTKREKIAEIAFGLEGNVTQEQESLMDVTLDRYGVKIKTPPNLDGVLPAFDAVIAYSGHLDDGAEFVKWDHKNEQFIFNPLADWNSEQIIGAILEHEIPVNYPLDILALDKENKNVPLHLTRGKTTSMQTAASAN